MLREETSHDALESLNHGRVDCVLLALPFDTGDAAIAHIADDRLFIAFPKDDPRDPPATITPDMIDQGRLLLGSRQEPLECHFLVLFHADALAQMRLTLIGPEVQAA